MGESTSTAGGTLVAQFKSVDGVTEGPQLDIPVDTTPQQLQLLINELLQNVTAAQPKAPHHPDWWRQH